MYSGNILSDVQLGQASQEVNLSALYTVLVDKAKAVYRAKLIVHESLLFKLIVA